MPEIPTIQDVLATLLARHPAAGQPPPPAVTIAIQQATIYVVPPSQPQPAPTDPPA
jgi:hypothetical protein